MHEAFRKAKTNSQFSSCFSSIFCFNSHTIVTHTFERPKERDSNLRKMKRHISFPHLAPKNGCITLVKSPYILARNAFR